MVTGKRVGAPPTLLQKYPELRRFADPAEEFDGPASPQIAAARLSRSRVWHQKLSSPDHRWLPAVIASSDPLR